MPTSLELPRLPIVNTDGTPALWFAQLLRDTIATNTAISNLSGDADDIADGITRRIREIAREEIDYNADGTINQIVYKDPNTSDVLLTEDINYSSGQVTRIEQTDPAARKTIYDIQYSNDLVDVIIPSFEGYG